MVAALRKRLNAAPGDVVAAFVALAAALVAVILPEWRLVRLVVDSGLPNWFPPAAPPLGWTARMLFVAAVAGFAGGATWIAARLLFSPRPMRAAAPRRADAHPDAPLREPVKAMRDLGTPFLEVTVGERGAADRTVPNDLEQPLAAYDPAAIPDEPLTPSVAVMPLYRPTPPNHPVPLREPPRLHVETMDRSTPLPIGASIDSMIERLEQGLHRRGRPLPGDRAELDKVLATLEGVAAPR